MKKYIFIALAALTLVSCNEKPQKTETSATESIETSDNTFTLKDIDYKAPQYFSADLAMQELGGRVKSMDYTAVECTIKDKTVSYDNPAEGESIHFDFDEKGIMTHGFMLEGEQKGPDLKRNSKGQIERTERFMAQLNFTYVNTFTYNENSNIESEEVTGQNFSGKTINHYTDGVLTSANAEQQGEGVSYVTTSTFKVVEVDHHGNWTKRLCTSETKSNTGETVKETGIELRYIVYY